MLSLQDCPGITYLTMEEIYRKISTLDDKICEVGISYLEVYNETVRDLLSPAGKFSFALSLNTILTVAMQVFWRSERRETPPQSRV